MTRRSGRHAAPVFIVGSPRSGTTWLYHMLLSAGDVAVYRAEASVFNLLGPRFGDLAEPRNRSALLDAWLPSEFFRRSGLDALMFRARVEADCRTPGDLLRLFMSSIAEQQAVSRWAECTPENILYLEEIKKSIPDALFVHIVRDGRDVARSLAAQGWIAPRQSGHESTRLVHAGLYWEWMVGRGRRNLEAWRGDRYEVRYEELVRSPVETLSALAGFLDHDLDYKRILDRGIGTVSRPNTSFPEAPGRAFSPIGRWGEVPPRTLARLEAAIGGLLEELGYALGTTEEARRRERGFAEAARRLAHGYFSSRLWLKTRTPLGQVFTNPALLSDFHAFDRPRVKARPESERSA